MTINRQNDDTSIAGKFVPEKLQLEDISHRDTHLVSVSTETAKVPLAVGLIRFNPGRSTNHLLRAVTA